MDRIRKIGLFLNNPSRAGFLFILPAVIIIFTFSILPLLVSFVVSLFDINVFFTNIKFVGFDNFIKAFNDPRFWNAWRVTIVFTVFDVPLAIIFSLFVAVQVAGTKFYQRTLRTIFILPLICSSTVTGLMWRHFLNPQIGWGVYALNQLGVPKFSLFGDMQLALYGIIIIAIWRQFGVSTMILVAAMQGVPPELYEAAEIDGANKVRQFFNVTIPGIMPILWFQLITRVVGSFQVFDSIYIITQGGPANTTNTIVYYIYDTAFRTNTNLSYATAMAETMFVVILLISITMISRMIKQEMK